MKLEKDTIVNITSQINATVGITCPDLGVRLDWDKKGIIRTIQWEQLRKLFYENGVEYMFTNGVLDIDRMDVKIELGLEEPETTVPTNVIVLNDSQRLQLLKVATFGDFSKQVDKLPREQVKELAQYAAEKKIGDMTKWDYLKTKTGIDVIAITRLND